MQNGLRQLNASYDPLQDRIQFNISVQDGTEFKFWITRRFMILAWSMLGQAATLFANERANGDPLRRAAMAEIAHHEAQNSAMTEEQYEGGVHHPLGSDPVLLAKINLKQDQSGRMTLSLLPDSGHGADIGLDERTTHLLAALLHRVSVAAEWQLSLPSLSPTPFGIEGSTSQLH